MTKAVRRCLLKLKLYLFTVSDQQRHLWSLDPFKKESVKLYRMYLLLLNGSAKNNNNNSAEKLLSILSNVVKKCLKDVWLWKSSYIML